MTMLSASGLMGPSVAFRFFAFNAHDPRLLGRLFGIFVRGVVGAVAIGAVVGAVIVVSMWCVSTLRRVRHRGASTVTRAGRS